MEEICLIDKSEETSFQQRFNYGVTLRIKIKTY